MKLFNGSHSKAMAWIILIASGVIAITLKAPGVFITGMTISGGLVVNKTYQVRKA